MTKFKEDDVVKCINFEGISNLNAGVTYRATHCNEHYVSLSIDSSWKNGSYPPNTFSVDRFELVQGPATYKWPVPEHNHLAEYEDNDEESFDSTDMTACEKALRYEIAIDLLKQAADKLEDYHICGLAEEINVFLGEN